jgi:esterase/lipase
VIQSENISFQSCGETLIGTIEWNVNKDKPTVLCLHGSQPGNRGYIEYLTTALAAEGLSCFRFDHAGHGESSGTLEKATLNHLIQQAVDALQFMDSEKPLIVVGASLGGGPALELLERANIGTMILLAPGAWSVEGYDAAYGEERYRYHVSTAEEALRAPVFEKLKKFTGKFLHVIGSDDDVIKPEVTRQMKLNSVNTSISKFIVFEGIGHRFRAWLMDNPKEKDKFVNAVIQFIKQ